MKLLKVFSIALVLLSSPWALAEKIAVLGVQEALLASNEAKSFKESLDKELKADEKRLVELEKQAKTLREKAQKEGANMSQEQRQQTRLQFQKAFDEYQRTGQMLQQKRIEKEQEFISKMRPKLDEVIRKLIEKNGYDIVVAKQATVFTAKGVDITKTVVEMLNKQ
ncbi:OmpH family outer membrane protein [Neptunomonas concharum]|uniref:OmpH family outer membrane protein n=1 Tax=Neptunomonas concharum TaxID=1031538 RepID=A0A5P1R8U5_9GAMM|nr:OmpH family outer membrane protein [Neptunomonas concharum]QEQ95722.1 OmpH family outer membrane protein [Neptunomonas concharum]